MQECLAVKRKSLCGEVKKLVELRKQFGVPGKHPMEKLCPGCYEGDDTCSMSPTEANEKYGVESSAAYHGFPTASFTGLPDSFIIK